MVLSVSPHSPFPPFPLSLTFLCHSHESLFTWLFVCLFLSLLPFSSSFFRSFLSVCSFSIGFFSCHLAPVYFYTLSVTFKTFLSLSVCPPLTVSFPSLPFLSSPLFLSSLTSFPATHLFSPTLPFIIPIPFSLPFWLFFPPTLSFIHCK